MACNRRMTGARVLAMLLAPSSAHSLVQSGQSGCTRHMLPRLPLRVPSRSAGEAFRSTFIAFKVAEKRVRLPTSLFLGPGATSTAAAVALGRAVEIYHSATCLSPHQPSHVTYTLCALHLHPDCQAEDFRCHYLLLTLKTARWWVE